MKNEDLVLNGRSPVECARVLTLLLALTTGIAASAANRRNGTSVIEAKPEFKVIAENKIKGDDTDFNATPAIVGRQLFLRSNRILYCIESVQTAGAGKTQ